MSGDMVLRSEIGHPVFSSTTLKMEMDLMVTMDVGALIEERGAGYKAFLAKLVIEVSKHLSCDRTLEDMFNQGES